MKLQGYFPFNSYSFNRCAMKYKLSNYSKDFS